MQNIGKGLQLETLGSDSTLPWHTQSVIGGLYRFVAEGALITSAKQHIIFLIMKKMPSNSITGK